MPSEFDLIRRFFTRPSPHAALGVGDDAALVRVGEGMELAISTDMLLSGRHFFPDADPYQLGWKTLAVNLSDMAAMGATPRWATLSLALPEADERWLAAFSQGFFALADQYAVDLVGGDTTRGPLTLCVQIMGEVPAGRALRRSGAQPGDEIWVSGKLGDAALALTYLQHRIELAPDEAEACLPALHTPQPRVELGLGLLGIARSAIDISDGLLADLGHILECSNVGADIEFPAVPASAILKKHLGSELGQNCLLAGGDDYELCFTAPADKRGEILALGGRLGVQLTPIGVIKLEAGVRVLDGQGSAMPVAATGYDHFGAGGRGQ